MAKSFRLSAELQRRLEQAAARAGVPVSTFIRDAVLERCQAVLGPSLLDELGESVGAFESGRLDTTRTGQEFADMLAMKRRPRK
jgi:predicted transcriptional regulator